jgi:hypothetical protein
MGDVRVATGIRRCKSGVLRSCDDGSQNGAGSVRFRREAVQPSALRRCSTDAGEVCLWRICGSVGP